MTSSFRLQALPTPPYAEVWREEKSFMEAARHCPSTKLGSCDGRASSPWQVPVPIAK